MTIGREVRLAAIPRGVPTQRDFELVEVDLPAPQEDEILVRNLWMSLDPSMRIRMRGEPSSYLTPFVVGQPLDGFAVGVVVESGSRYFGIGDHVLHSMGWRDFALVDATDAGGYRGPTAIDVTGRRRPEEYLGALGPVGLTSWAGLLKVAELRDGDVVFVSAAAGAVGSLAVQIAKALGHRVIGSAGSPEKVRYVLDALGADAAFTYQGGDLTEKLRACAPEGIDVYFDNVGGEHLAAALEVLNVGGRVALCGMISGYSSEEMGRMPGNLFNAIAKGINLRGFLARMYAEHFEECQAQVARWLDSGVVTCPEYIVEGLDQAPTGFISMLTGQNTGKTLVRIS